MKRFWVQSKELSRIVAASDHLEACRTALRREIEEAHIVGRPIPQLDYAFMVLEVAEDRPSYMTTETVWQGLELPEESPW